MGNDRESLCSHLVDHLETHKWDLGWIGGCHGKWCVKDICQFIIQHKRQHHPFFKNLTVTYREAIEDVYKDFLGCMAWKKEDLVPTPKVEARGTKLNMDEGVNVKHGRKPGGGVDSRRCHDAPDPLVVPLPFVYH